MILDKHVWRTDDDRLVWDGDLDAAFLAYPRLTEIPDATARQLGLLGADGKPTDGRSKKAPAPADKARKAPPANKGA